MITIKKINIDDLEFRDGRYVYTFTPEVDMDAIQLESSCFGDTTLNYLQVEQNPDMTYFVPPEVYEGNLSGIFKDLKELNLEMTDTESDLWGRIKINAQGMIEEWHNDVTSVEIAKTSEAIGAQLTNLDKKLSNEIVITAQGLKTSLSDLEKNLTNEMNVTAKGIRVDLTDLERKLNNNITVSASGLKTEMENMESGLKSQLTSTSNYLRSLISDANSNYSSLTQTVDGIDLKLGNLERGTNTQLSVLKSQLASTVTAKEVESIIQQNADSIRLSIEDKLNGNKLKSAINLSTDGIRLKSDLIYLSGRSYIENGVIRDAHIGSLSATKITTGTLNAANVRVINLDVNNLTGSRAEFIKAGFTAVNSRLTINGVRLRIDKSDGSFVELNNVPEVRSEDARGTGVVLGQGRIHFFDTRQYSKGYLGVELHNPYNNDLGLWLSRGGGGFTIAQSTTTTAQQTSYIIVNAGEGLYQVASRAGITINTLLRLNNITLNSTIHPGDRLKIREYEVQLSGTRYENMMRFGVSTSGQNTVYVDAPMRVEGRTAFTQVTDFHNAIRALSNLNISGDINLSGRLNTGSDRLIKKEIKPSTVRALDEINKLKFKEFRFKADNRYSPIGLIAQDAGLMRVQGGDIERVDLERGLYLALKAIQELEEKLNEINQLTN